jgi:hypothetical protein
MGRSTKEVYPNLGGGLSSVGQLSLFCNLELVGDGQVYLDL